MGADFYSAMEQIMMKIRRHHQNMKNMKNTKKMMNGLLFRQSRTSPAGESMQIHLDGSGNIKSIEVAQVMGKGVDLETGDLYLMSSHVAGKNTAILVELNEPVEIDPLLVNTQYVTVSKDGKEIARLKPLGSAKNLL